jgi:hypothetical protein
LDEDEGRLVIGELTLSNELLEFNLAVCAGLIKVKVVGFVVGEND